jgi:DNA mismatch repair protein MutL
LSDVLGDPEKCAEDVRRKLVAVMACKKAVKANDKLNDREGMALLRELRRCRNGLNCPHGRPTMLIMSPIEIARRFKRT